MAVAVAWVAGPEVLAFFETTVGLPASAAIFATGMVTGTVISTATSVISGGGVGDGFKRGIRGALWNGASALFSNVVGDLFQGTESWGFKTFGKEYLKEAKAVAHGVVQGGLGQARGESFFSGFVSGASGNLVDSGPGIGGALRGAMVGGTAAALSGGKFADGVMQSAFTHLFNEMLHPAQTCGSASECQREQSLSARRDAKLANQSVFSTVVGIGFNQAGKLFYDAAEQFDLFPDASVPEKYPDAKPKVGRPPWTPSRGVFELNQMRSMWKDMIVNPVSPESYGQFIGKIDYGIGAVAEWNAQRIENDLCSRDYVTCGWK